MTPELTHHPLVRADGSATFSSKPFTILASVNGPIEVQRRDELPEEAAIEVNVRPSAGAGGPRERWMESVIVSLLRSLLLVHMNPRTLIQVTLQVTKEPTVKLKKAMLDIAIIPSLANAAFLALVDGALPMNGTATGGLAVVKPDSTMTVDPTEADLKACKSIHTMVYTAKGDLLLDESAGLFTMTEWEAMAKQLKKSVVGAMRHTDEDHAMMNGNAEDEPWMRRALEERVQQAGAWRESG